MACPRRVLPALLFAVWSAWLGVGAVPAPAASAAAPVRPSAAAIARVLAGTIEVAPGGSARCKASACERLHQDGRTVVVADGHGGWLTAVPAVRWPTADGYGQVVLFWHDRVFLGSETLARLPSLGTEAASLAIVRSGRDRIVVRFARYRPSDAMCCPSLRPVEIVYRWNGRALKASAPVPAAALLESLSLIARVL